MFANLRIGAVIPARDEALAIAHVVSDLRALRNDQGSAIIDHIVVCDNGSKDATAALAVSAGAAVVTEAKAGYGRACLAAIRVLPEVDVILFVDGDCSIVIAQTERLLTAIAQGADLALGGRHLGHIEKNAMTFPQRYGTRCVVHAIRWLWSAPFGDLGPFRAVRKRCYDELNMQDERYGWTIEMQVKAFQQGWHCVEVPVDTTARLGKSKISGTVRGVIGAAFGMLRMVAGLWWRARAENWKQLPARN
jgi:glycosyltransferase involved in cell wall biosynthesis